MMHRLYRSKWLLKRTIIFTNCGTALRLVLAHWGPQPKRHGSTPSAPSTQPEYLRFAHLRFAHPIHMVGLGSLGILYFSEAESMIKNLLSSTLLTINPST
jgi:hypothetical protein